MIIIVEPGKIILTTERTAIEEQRANCYTVKGEDLYSSDQEALEDFISVNWAKQIFSKVELLKIIEKQLERL